MMRQVGPAGTGTARRVIGAGHHDLDAVAIDAEIGGEPFGGRLAGHDDACELGQQPLLDAEQRRALGLAEAGLERGRVMDQADGIARRQCIVQSDEGRQREAIDDRPRPIGDAVPCRSGGVDAPLRPPADACPPVRSRARCGPPRAGPRRCAGRIRSRRRPRRTAPARSAKDASGDRRFVGRPRIRAFAQQDLEAGHRATAIAETSVAAGGGEQAVDVERDVFGRRVDAAEGGIVVQVAVVERIEHAAQFGLRQADIDQELQMVEFRRTELRLHREGRAVQSLRRPEFLAVEAVGDHDVVADGQAEHGWPNPLGNG